MREGLVAERVAAAARREGLAGAPALEALAAESERIAREEREVALLRPVSGRAAAASARTMRRAAELHREVRLARRASQVRWGEVEELAAGSVARAQVEIGTPGMGAAAARALAQARSLLGEARRLAAAGEHRRAVEVGERALSAAATVRREWDRLHARFERPEDLARWQRWADDSLREAAASKETLILVDKLHRRLEVFAGGRLRATFAAELGANGLERKLHAGDRATPEGRYRVVEKRGPGATRYHRALLLDYPNREDLERWRRAGEKVGAGPGGLIEIHGEGGRGRDWTDGCVALANGDMDRLFDMVAVGSAVTIVGTYRPGRER